MDKISDHISYREAVKSNTATRRGIYIKNHLDFDQIIWEFGDDKNPAWVHVSYVSEEDNRHRCLKAYKENGKTKYKVI